MKESDPTHPTDHAEPIINAKYLVGFLKPVFAHGSDEEIEKRIESILPHVANRADTAGLAGECERASENIINANLGRVAGLLKRVATALRQAPAADTAGLAGELGRLIAEVERTSERRHSNKEAYGRAEVAFDTFVWDERDAILTALRQAPAPVDGMEAESAATTDTPSEAGLVEALKARAAATLERISASVEAHPPAEKLVPRLRDRITALEAENAALRDMLREARDAICSEWNGCMANAAPGSIELVARIDALTKDQNNEGED